MQFLYRQTKCVSPKTETMLMFHSVQREGDMRIVVREDMDTDMNVNSHMIRTLEVHGVIGMSLTEKMIHPALGEVDRGVPDIRDHGMSRQGHGNMEMTATEDVTVSTSVVTHNFYFFSTWVELLTELVY